MVSSRDFISGVIAGLLHMFISPFVLGVIPSFPFDYYITQPVMLGVWVVIATFILEKTGH
jgi:hypothetical protein